MGTNGCDLGTTVYGMPYVGFEPKSGCRNCFVELMLAMYSAELGFTGSFEMFSFQGLLGGKTWQPPSFVSDVSCGVGAFVGDVVW